MSPRARSAGRPIEAPMEKSAVLLLAANPRGTRPLDPPQESREIQAEVRLGDFRDALELGLVPGARPVDLRHKFNIGSG
jgi:hypothetical protein